MTCRLMCRTWAAFLLLVVVAVQADEWTDQVPVDGYTSFGRGSCQDQRGMMYSYLQRVMAFPNPETCAQQECERFGTVPGYVGFEFSVAKRCTCLFAEEMPVVPNEPNAPDYVTKKDNGVGQVAQSSMNPGTHCYLYGNSGVMTGSMGVFFTAIVAMLFATV